MKRFLIALVTVAMAVIAPAYSFDDIDFWAGTGANRAALVIDWNDGLSDGSTVWGYRWDGDATGEDMLRAIVAVDPNLYIKVSGQTPYGVALFGIGYDRNGDGFGIDTGETFVNQIVEADYNTTDGGAALDPEDSYREGWYTGYWSYWLGGPQSEMPSESEWGYSGVGMSGRYLTNDSWDGWSYLPDFMGGPPRTAATTEAVPEPASMAVIAIGLAALTRRRRVS